MRQLKALVQLVAALTCLGAAIALLIQTGLPQRAAYAGFARGGRAPTAPEVGAFAPGFALPTAAGRRLTLDQVDGDAIILNSWATWCGPCRQESRDLQRLFSGSAGKVRVLAINLGERAEQVKAWVAEQGLSYDVLLDSHNQIAQRYQIRGAPTTFLLDRSHRVRQIYYGAVALTNLRADINRLGDVIG